MNSRDNLHLCLSKKIFGETRKTWRIDHLFTIHLQYGHLLVVRPLDFLFTDGVNLHNIVWNFVIIQEGWKNNELKKMRKWIRNYISVEIDTKLQ